MQQKTGKKTSTSKAKKNKAAKSLKKTNVKAAAVRVRTAVKKPQARAASISMPIKQAIQSKPAHSKSGSSLEERKWAMYCDLASFTGFVFPLGFIIGPLAIWLFKRAEFPFVERHGKETINFQISMTIYFCVAFLLFTVYMGATGFILVTILMVVIQLSLVTKAAIQAQAGGFYEYPLTIRLIK
jgi:uncharacterized Tic20 family protein